MDWSLFSAQGVAQDQRGKYEAAQLSYARALILKPGESSVLNNDALSHMQSGDLDGAEILLRQATPGTPDYPRLAENLALVQRLKAARPVKAIEAAPVQAAAAQPPPVPVEPPPVPVEPSPAPVVVSAPVSTADLPVPNPPLSVTAETQPAPNLLPAVPQDAKGASRLEILRADPTVVMAPVHKDSESPLRPLKTTSEPTALPKPAEKKPAETTPQPKSLPALRQAPSKTLYVQAGAFYTEKQAGESASGLDRLGARVMSGVVEGRAVYRVRIGPFLTVQQAKAAFAQAQALGRSDLNIVRD